MSHAARTRLATTAAMLGVAVMTLGAVVTAIAYRGRFAELYSPLNHWVSELGEVGISELSAVFNVSLMIGGVCFAIFIALLAMSRTGWLRYLYGGLGVVAGLAGSMVGVFPMNDLDRHGLAALTFFNLGWITVGLASLDFVIAPEPRFPRWLAVIGLFTVVAFVGFLVSLQVDPLVGDDMLAAPENRPGVWVVASLEWAIIVGILAWTALTAWCWRRVGATES